MNQERPQLDDETFRLLSDLVHDYCGISFHEDMRFLLERRLHTRLEILGLHSFRDYYRYLRFDSNRQRELEEAAELLTTNETYFFREQPQLRAFTGDILPGMAESRGRRKRLRIWSAGCSTGEEAYTIAMLLLESGLFEGWRLDVFGTDISRAVLATARRGVYRQHALRETDERFIHRYFETAEDGARRVSDEVRRIVSFGHLNLADPQMMGLVGEMDVIFCRNVLIYFGAEVKRALIGRFYEHLAPGGYLLLGHSESLLNLSTDFELVHLDHDLVYRRPEEKR
ncbi:MAG: methyltransferase [Deltaproteobacteria bacterium]|nr:methyltransferase [Deltaproteobacteria bacterium]